MVSYLSRQMKTAKCNLILFLVFIARRNVEQSFHNFSGETEKCSKLIEPKEVFNKFLWKKETIHILGPENKKSRIYIKENMKLLKYTSEAPP